MNNPIKSFVVCLLFLLGIQCTNTDTIAGGGSNTGNANVIAGHLVEPDGITPAQCVVYLYPSDRIPVLPSIEDTNFTYRDSTDNKGRFIFVNVPPGNYNIYCEDKVSYISKIIFGTIINVNDSVSIGIDTLRYKTSLSGNVLNGAGRETIAFIPGSPLIATVNDTSGYFLLNDIPSGDSLNVLFKSLNPPSGIQCNAEYQVSQLPDTTMFITIELECK
jgi:hypothetical protein